MNSFLIKYIGYWLLSFSITVTLAFILEGGQPTFIQAVCIGSAFLGGCILVLKKEYFSSLFHLEEKMESTSDLKILMSVALGIGFMMFFIFQELTSSMTSLVLGVLCALFFLSLMILILYGENEN
ncbi:MAG: hypothetical protein WC882_03010 [Candidatus Gracilibacteria bacterium]